MKIAIAGYGVEGEGNYHYYARDPENDITIVDQKDVPDQPLPAGVKTLLAPDAFEKLDGFDLVVRTAGLAPYKIKTDGKVWSSTNEFFAKCPTPIIGVTGSKGKGTTVSLIAAILRADGKKVHVVGNIGVSALEELPDIQPSDIVVFELSSFQLWDAQTSPHTAVVLFMEPEHQDVHRSVDEYVKAKAQITIHQRGEDDTLIYKTDNQYVAQIAALSPARKVPFQGPETAHVQDDWFWYGEQKICSVSTLKLPGLHNQDNACAAIDAAWQYVSDPAVIEQGISSFEGLEHRLKLVREIDEVKYYDDSIATTPGSAIAALKAFVGPKVLILGGSSKGADFSELAETVTKQNTKAVITIGTEASHIEQALNQAGYSKVTNLGMTTMSQIVQTAHGLASPGDIVILSPSCASFDMFKNYADRGEQFIAAVQQLG